MGSAPSDNSIEPIPSIEHSMIENPRIVLNYSSSSGLLDTSPLMSEILNSLNSRDVLYGLTTSDTSTKNDSSCHRENEQTEEDALTFEEELSKITSPYNPTDTTSR